MRRNNFASRERFFNQLDHRGLIDYTTGDEEFDQQIGNVWHQRRQNPEKFIGTGVGKYPEAEVMADLRKIGDIKNSPDYSRERSGLATMAEYSLAEGLGNRGWLGEESSANITSEYDDIKAGADILITVPDTTNPETDEDLIFVVDITSSTDQTILNDKIRSEFTKLDHGDRTRLKYFKGLKKPVNRFIIGLEPEKIRTITDVIMDRYGDDETETEIRLEIFDEIIYQASVQIDFLLSKHKLPDYQETDDPDEIMAYVNSHQAEIASSLPPEMQESLRVNRGLVEYIQNIKTEVLTEKKQEVQVLNPHDPAYYLTHFQSRDLLAA